MNGMSLGSAADLFFNKKNSKHGDGYNGLVSNNAVTRRSASRDGVMSALARFMHPELFE